MRSAVFVLFLGSLAACERDAPADADAAPTASALEQEIAGLVLADLASPAFGNQKVAPTCVKVGALAKGEAAEVVSARLDPECIEGEIFDDMLWVFKRGSGEATWSEEYLGPEPKCWGGVPAEIAGAVGKATGIEACAE